MVQHAVQSGGQHLVERDAADRMVRPESSSARQGLAGARVNDIADRAGVNKQLISYYFGGKEGLFA